MATTTKISYPTPMDTDPSAAAEMDESDECGFILPFTLQDLCLLTIINNPYPDEILASLPLWLRRRLLNNLPAVDVARLASTPVARDVNIAEIWKPRTIAPNVYCNTARWDNKLAHPFTMATCRDEDNQNEFILRPADIPNLDPELLEIFRDIPKGIIPDVGISPGCAVVVHDVLRDPDSSGDVSLANVGMTILNSIDPVLDKWSRLDPKKYSTITDHLKMVADHLVSINGEILMGGMTGIRKPIKPKEDGELQEKYRQQLEEFQTKYEQWNRQVTPLAKHQDKEGTIYHTPLRSLKLRSCEDPIEVFSLMTQKCALRPTNIMIDYTKLFTYVEKRELDKEKFDDVLKKSMVDVVLLGLWRQEAGSEPTMAKTIVEGVVGDGKNCKLKVLYCRKLNEPEYISMTLSPYLCTVPPNTEPPLYTDLRAVDFTGLDFGALPYVVAILKQHKLLKVVHIDQVSSWATIHLPVKEIPKVISDLFHTCGELFHREIFYALRFRIHHTMVKTGNPMMMKSLLLGFMTAPCNHEQQLMLDHQVEYSYRIRDLEKKEIASFEYEEGRSVPDCSINRKRFISKTPHVHLLLLRLPVIRLRELTIDCGVGRQVHHTAHHPNLSVGTLTLILEKDLRKEQFVAEETLVEDLKLLFKKPLLREVSIRGHWGAHEVAMEALTEAFKAQAEVNDLQKIAICIANYRIQPHTVDTLDKFWAAICALPRLDDVKVTIYGDEYLEITKSIQVMVYENWVKYSEGRKFKEFEYISICRQEFNVFFEVTHSFVQTKLRGLVSNY